MSTAIAKNFQIGADATATNNFTIRQPATPDGTVRIANGNTGTTTDLVTVTSAGNVGIGTSSIGSYSGYKVLAITGTTTTTSSVMDHKSSNASVWAQQSVDSSGYTFNSVTAHPIVFKTTNTERARIDSNGNVGIGTSSPNLNATGTALTLLGTSTNRGNFEVGSSSATSTGVFGQIAGHNGSSTLATLIQFFGDGATDSGAVKIFTKATGGSISERARIDSSGNLLVGTTTATAKLTVDGSFKANQNFNTGGGILIDASASYNNNTQNLVGGGLQNAHSIIHIVTTGGGMSSIPIYPNGGSGIAYTYNYMNPSNGGWTYTYGSDLNFSFTNAGSVQNTYNIIVTSGSGNFYIQRTSGSAAYTVYVQRFAFFA